MKKGTVILVLIAVVLAIIAISMQLSGPSEVKTVGNSIKIDQDREPAQISLTIDPPVVEDKLAGVSG